MAEFSMQFVGPQDSLDSADGRLVDVLDGLLDHGVMIRGELWLSVAEVDLVVLGLDLVLANPDTLRGLRPAP